MSCGDLRVLRQEPGQESPRMPAWKREILERRKAKGGGSGAGAESVASRLNGEVTASKSKDDISSAHSSRNCTITAANRATKSPDLSPVKTKEHWTSADPSRTEERTARDNGAHESLVLQESLGPLQENPFINQHILELYGGVPGIRTIRAENIIIIESDPEYFSEGCGLKHASKLQQNGTVSGYSSLNDLLDRRGSPVTEIRAKEVVIYDTALSKSEENLSTLGRPASAPLEGQGRVSRMLQKFDRNYGKLQAKSRSTENLLDLDCSPVRPSSRPKPDVVPKCPVSPQAGSPHSKVFQNVQSSMSNHHASPSDSGSSTPVSGSPQLVSSTRRRFEGSEGRSVTVYPKEDTERSPSKPVRERDWDSTDGASKAKVPCSPESHRARADCTPSPTSPPLSPSFEIRPSPRPDLSLLPPGDLQARALANLRLQSRNSFTVIPKSRAAISSPGSTAPSSPVLSPPSPQPLVGVAASEPTVPTPSPASFIHSTPKLTEKVTIEAKTGSPQHTPPATPTSPAPASPPSIGSPVKSVSSPKEPPLDKLPITNIDDLVVEPTPPVLSPAVQRRKGNTFTVVPKRRPEAQSGPAETPEVVSESQSTPQAPYTHLGTLIKKRYPAAEEIKVIGGYLSLGRSCLSKTGSTGKKLKISFNESSLQSTFEYPSENSVWDSGEDEEEGEEKGGEDDGGIIAGRISIPRASYTSSPTHSNNITDLSSYTPKHSVEFNAWQEHKLDESAHQGEDTSQSTEEVMLTPADSSSLSDFSSEPALYF
ncbi:LOW QUALITY PROTEIN: taperin-like [Sinocyclocheilus anshuiensis]|uniref:LOW QUALITY PROTEIN: taperin-like n=1 Tax=Sinocyclocheilus anshuiensis TaxID=1608454 RepID=UPI0007BA7500|nr:PREDICTED: LOW QUALITY PROTEIN: taperin-like [Sinocyclocheilus anshuiensis]